MRRAAALLGLLLCMAAVPSVGRTNALPQFGWVQDGIGLPMIPDTASGKLLDPVRRIVPDPHVPGRFLLGTALFGIYESAGAGWTTLSPNCFDPIRPPDINGNNPEDLLGSLSGCGIEGIAFDPQDQTSLYVSTYNLGLIGCGSICANPAVNPGGIFKANIKFGSLSVSTAGVTWRKLLGGVRGNAIAVSRPSASAPATIIAGRIQAGGGIGTDNNPFCSNCNPSLWVSQNDGATWAPHTFPPTAGCNDANVTQSSRLAGNVTFDPVNAGLAYVATNAGVYYSTNLSNPASWTLALKTCPGSAGIAITTKNPRKIYFGLPDGSLWRGDALSTGPANLTQIIAPGVIQNQILSLQLDARDPNQRTLFAASWRAGVSKPSGGGGVWKIVDGSSGVTVADIKASFLDPDGYPAGLQPTFQSVKNTLDPLPFPFYFDKTWRSSLFLAQHPLTPDLLFVSTVFGGVWVRSGP